ncbi:MAG: hypothetical protein SGI88_04810 [Candidatus Hydrogenedentes bacterium]|nr:hypothetical protein [Candidatus Hydrogenedentota bacterium]
MRGARGITIFGGEIYIANYSRIFRYDQSFRQIGEITHSCCADIHDLAFHDGQLWAASTRNDMLIAMNRDGRITDTVDVWDAGDIEHTFGVRRSNKVNETVCRERTTHDKLDTDLLHVNSFAFSADGDLVVSLGQIRVNGHSESALLRLGVSDGAEVIYHSPTAPVPAHNVLRLPNGRILHAQTQHGQVIEIDPRTKTHKALISARTGYIRGLALLNEHTLAVGVQNEVWLCDIESGVILECIVISNDARESVHSIACLGADAP